MKNHIFLILFLIIIPTVLADISSCDLLLNQSKTEFQIKREYNRCVIKNADKPEDCENIKDRFINYDKCLEEYYSNVLDINECEKAQDKYYGKCYGNTVARDSNLDVSSCNTIMIEKSKQDCIHTVISKRGIKDANECLKVEGNVFQKECARYVISTQATLFTKPDPAICNQHSGSILQGCKDYFEHPSVGLKGALAILGGGILVMIFGMIGYSLIGLYFIAVVVGIILVVKSKNKEESNKILNLLILPGLGTIREGHTFIGIIQIILFTFGLILLITYIGAILGFIFILSSWIWSLIFTLGKK